MNGTVIGRLCWAINMVTPLWLVRKLKLNHRVAGD